MKITEVTHEKLACPKCGGLLNRRNIGPAAGHYFPQGEPTHQCDMCNRIFKVEP